jgi:hypothetical protein
MLAAAQQLVAQTLAKPPTPADGYTVFDLVSTTDGIIFHLWPMGDKLPTGGVTIDQAVGHKPMTAEEYARSKPAPK